MYKGKGVKRINYTSDSDKIIVYVNNNNKGCWGVRRENVCYKTFTCENNFRPSCMLSYSKPCVCGSLTHVRTTHADCILNKRYPDIQEKE